MVKKLRIIFKYIAYRLKAKTKFGIHSPFVFDFITSVLEDKRHYVSYGKVEELHKCLLKNRNLIEVEDFGAGSGTGHYKTRLERVQSIAARTSITQKEGRLLHRITKYFKPDIMIELGTSLGVSSMYQSTGSPDGFFIGIEGSATIAAIAEQNLYRVAEDSNYSMVIGHFDKMLPHVLQKLEIVDYVFLDGNHAYKPTISYFKQLLPYFHEKSVMIIHDIHWSDDMERAWEEIRQNEKVTITLDLFTMGIIFFRNGIPKQDFIIRF
jgi:predicted O-methyltransferase YrrM